MKSDNYSLIEYEDYWKIPLLGRTVSRFLLDNALSIQFIDVDRENVVVTIEQPFRLCLEGNQYELSPKRRTELAPVFSLLHKTVTSAVGFKTGTLELEFQNQGKLLVPPHPNYEAWGITGERGLRLVCSPGGDLSVWDADPREIDQ